MNPGLIGTLVVVSQFLVALALLFIAGRFVRNGLARAEATDLGSIEGLLRFTRHLRALEELLVQFVARSNESSRILSVLASQPKPLRVTAIVQEVSLEQDRSRDYEVLAMGVACAVLSILQVSGLIRMTCHGFVITEAGLEIHRRIEAHLAQTAKVTRVPGVRKLDVASVWRGRRDERKCLGVTDLALSAY